ncbi:peptidylprolyl isomerase [uncultured Nonlabens sp.]|uniref:peptidylprolyl isomerase n=1 Tax=uncultured Nonlabens sp. TaxID=859306 RepID=UPI002632E223|nr:peptidylprolyl isomerase [uncultured Nonlabens sp.]
MKNLSSLLFLISVFLFTVKSTAQNLDNKTLLTIDGTDYDAGTFMKFYFKNIDIVKEEGHKNIDNYLDLYIDYRLKLQQAYSLGLHEKVDYLKEIQSTRSSIAQAFLTDNEVSDKLIKEAYERENKEVNVSHILIKVDRTASPADTLKAWNKIHDIEKELQKGASFSSLARTKSEGPSAGNEGNLGWFGSFKMVYEFENAAFDTKKGSFSKPFRTDFGYHIVFVNDTRPNPGDLTVAHIMTFDKKNAASKTAQERIMEIYEQVQSGKDFKQLAREFSDDGNSAARGGKLNRFGTGGVDEDFANAAFALNKVGDYSEPIKTKYGWHIIKLLEKHPVQSYEDLKKELENRIKKSPRSRKITEGFINKLKTLYNMKSKNTLPKNVYEIVNDTLLLSGKYKFDNQVKGLDQKLFTLRESSFKVEDFLKYVEIKIVKDLQPYPSKKVKLDAYYKEYINEQLMAYHNKNLERDNEEFRFLYNEFKEGFLIFDLIEEKIWNKAKNDSIGLNNYFKSHQEDYKWKRRLDIDLTQNISQEVAEKVREQLIKKVAIDVIKSNLNIDNKTQVMVSSGEVEETYNRLPDNFEIKLGVSSVYHDVGDNFYKVINVKKIKEPTNKTLEEARGSVINAYQQQLEKNWLENLRKGHQIKVSRKVLKKVKKEIEKQLD